MRDLLLRALRCEKVERPPVWLMRQAGRYMPQYRALRARHSLWKLFHEPELAAQVTRQPLDILGVDAAILFSDILVIAEALGLSIHFPDSGGPRVEPPIRRPSQVHALEIRPVEEVLKYVFDTILLVKPSIDVPLIGFSGAPFTVASYLIDSTSKEAFTVTKHWLREDPDSFHALLQKITQVTISYLKAQIAAGVDVLQIFDSWANVLDEVEFSLFSLPYLKQIVEALRDTGVPLIVFCRGSTERVAPLVSLAPNAISFDWLRPIDELRRAVPSGIAIQGNFSPAIFKYPAEELVTEVRAALRCMQEQRGWIVNLGHGVTPDAPVEQVRLLVDTVQSYSR
jgi:uroporphyrinogen decarboxylase